MRPAPGAFLLRAPDALVLSIEEARARVLAALRPTGPEIVALTDAVGRILAAPVAARVDQPAHDASAMDGWAVRAADAIAGAELRMVAAAPAGHPTSERVGPGETIRVFTGSVIPAGADTVLIQENATHVGRIVRIDEATLPGRHIRPRGGDFSRGDTVLAPGLRLGARAVGLAASAGHPWLTVRRRPRIALLATGDEIVLPGEPIPPGGIASSNSYAIGALIRAAGGEPVILPVAPDQTHAIAEAAAEARHCDMLVTLGGASVGDHDLVRAALGPLGFDPDVPRIAMRPGKPLMHGHLHFGEHRVPVLGLPGNPVSAIVCAALFLRPAIDALLGLPAAAFATRRAVLGAPLRANDERADHIRATLSPEMVVTAMTSQDSSRLRDLTDAGALILRAPHAPAAEAGDSVEILVLAELGI